jgi:phosphohistidine phosphatase SixA
MSLKLVVAIRHAEYVGCEPDDSLAPRGIDKVKSLAEQISPLVNGSKVMIFTSWAGRTVQTSEIIKEKLGVPEVTVCRSLYGDDYSDGQEQMDDVLELVGEKDPDVIVAVSHCDAPSGIIDAFARKYLGKKVLGRWESMKGSAIVLDLSSGQIQKLFGQTN